MSAACRFSGQTTLAKLLSISIQAASVGVMLLSAIACANAAEPKPVASPASARCGDDADAPTDAFGFTDGAGIADRGGGSLGLTLNGDMGVRRGRSMGRGAMLQASYGLFPCFEISPYVLGGTTRSQFEREGLKDKAYGGGVDLKYRLLNHSQHGMGLTVGIDNGIERNEGATAGRFSTYNTLFRLMADKILIPDTLFGAVNVSHNLIWSGPSPHQRASTFAVGGSFAWQVMDGIYLSGEVRHMRQYNALGFGRRDGHATFAGPGIYWQATEQLALSVAYNVQVYGQEHGQPGRLDLNNFSRHLVQMDIGWTF